MTNRPQLKESSRKVRRNSSDKWFAALDRRRVGTPRNHWDIVVTGVHAAGSDCWIQVAAADDENTQLVLHVKPRTTVEAALAALTAASRDALPSVLSV